MNCKDLKLRFKNENVFYGNYNIGGKYAFDVKCIEKEEDGWHVYYIERGTRYDEKVFRKEEEACEYFYKWVTKKD